MASGSSDKVASSRLLTMAFMQRAIAKESVNITSPTTPSSKKRKTGHTRAGNALDQSPAFDQAALNAAMAEEEKKRQAALEQRARDLGDSRWVLRDPRNVTTGNAVQKPLNVVQVGFSQIDRDDDDSGDDKPVCCFHFNTKASTEKSNPTNQTSDGQISGSDNDESDSDSNSDSADDDDAPRDEQKRKVVIPSQKRAALARSSMLAEKRRRKDINLNRPTAISGTQSRSGPAPSNMSNIACYGCGKKGHIKAKCPHSSGFRLG